MGLTNGLNREELLSRLREDSRYDAAVLRIAEADYGCEEPPEDAPELVWLLALRADGQERSMEIPASAADALSLSEGKLFRLADLK